MNRTRIAAAWRDYWGQLDEWKRAALIPDRVRHAIRARCLAGEHVEALADDYAVPVAFIEGLCAWQLGRDEPGDVSGSTRNPGQNPLGRHET